MFSRACVCQSRPSINPSWNSATYSRITTSQRSLQSQLPNLSNNVASRTCPSSISPTSSSFSLSRASSTHIMTGRCATNLFPASVAWKPGRRSSIYLSRRAKPSLMLTSSHWRKKLPRKERIRSRRPSLATSLNLRRRPPMATARNFVEVQVITTVTVPADEVPWSHARRVNKGNPANVVTDMATLPQSASTSMPNATSAARRVILSKPVDGNGEPPRITWRNNLTSPVSVTSKFSMSMSTTQAPIRTSRILPM